MFNHILVPLDGSALAEAALPVAAYLANALGAEVTLLHLIEHNAPPEVHGQRHLTNKEDASAYLQETARRAFLPGVTLHTHVHTAAVSDVSRSIVDHTGELNQDLIVMCTHGRGGLRDLLAGSIAQQVIATGKTPVLLIRPREQGERQAVGFASLCVAMDGKDEHERGLDVVGTMAAKLGARLHLVTVIETLSTLGGKEAVTSRTMPAVTRAMLELAEESACDHLGGHAEAWEQMGIKVRSDVARGEPAAMIVRLAKEGNDDLIVLGTHGRRGMASFWSGSVAPRVLGLTDLPLLLIPVGKE
jgi:nucleotide-binding universal stress UspA family protein